jgi:hypothetical protein
MKYLLNGIEAGKDKKDNNMCWMIIYFLEPERNKIVKKAKRVNYNYYTMIVKDNYNNSILVKGTFQQLQAFINDVL